MEGRNHPFRSARDPRMTAAHPTAPRLHRARHDNRKREPTAMRILLKAHRGAHPRRDRGWRLRGYERLWHRHPSRVAEAPKPATQRRLCPPRRPPPSRRLEPRRRPPPIEPPARMTLSAAGRLRRLADQDLSRMLEAGAAAGRRRCLCRAGAPRLQSGRLAVEAGEARQSAVRPGSQTAGEERHGRGAELQPASGAGAISPVL